MTRTIDRLTWRDGKRRRSPRITAMDACKESQETSSNSGCMLHQEDSGDCKEPPTSKAKSKIKRKLDEAAFDAGSVETKPTQLPGKRILELILDTLQRRDINETFAQPVDPSEVEEYYEVVKEPMDFGTMRAKLHEGMYQNLEQFEHDVFLIPNNAMSFNSAGSTYFRQARAIYELAKKVFHVLRTDPENFEEKFPGARRRSTRKATGENKASKQSFDLINGSMKKDVSSKGTRPSLSGLSVFKRSKGRQAINVAATSAGKNLHNFYSDARKNRRPQSVEVDRRCTYRPPRSPFDNYCSSRGPTISSDPRSLILINQREISYKDSLMMFVKDLGPVAQTIAKKKLKGLLELSATCQVQGPNRSVQAPYSQISSAFGAPSWRFTDPILKTDSGKSNWKCAKDGEDAFRNSRIGDRGAILAHKHTEMKVTSKSNDVKAFKRKKVTQTSKTAEKNTATMIPKQKGLADTRGSEDIVLPVVLALEYTRPNPSEPKSKNKNSTEPPWMSMNKVGSNQGKPSSNSIPVHEASTKTTMKPPDIGVKISSNESKPMLSGFAFDMQFLKSRLDHMNHVGQDGFSKLLSHQRGNSWDTKGVGFTRLPEPSTKPPFVFGFNQSWPPPNTSSGTNLSLQL